MARAEAQRTQRKIGAKDRILSRAYSVGLQPVVNAIQDTGDSDGQN